MEDRPLLHGLDWLALGYAAALAFAVSWLMTSRARAVQRSQGLPLTPWDAVLSDTLLGAILGALTGLAAITYLESAKNAAGLFMASAAGSVVGPRLMDWLRSNGLKVLLAYVGHLAGGVGKAVREAREGEDDRETTEPKSKPPR